MLDGLLYHESELCIEVHYTDTQGGLLFRYKAHIPVN
ncbi:hypothetical protein FFE93_010375 [Yersinia sp. KBS0713]|nr:hypothetical protein FFE93_010375 [Yersinia sp. KBS0713]